VLCVGLWIPEVGGGAGTVCLLAPHLSHTHQGHQKFGKGDYCKWVPLILCCSPFKEKLKCNCSSILENLMIKLAQSLLLSTFAYHLTCRMYTNACLLFRLKCVNILYPNTAFLIRKNHMKTIQSWISNATFKH
jgi:hypothetical protein